MIYIKMKQKNIKMRKNPTDLFYIYEYLKQIPRTGDLFQLNWMPYNYYCAMSQIYF